jgi:hypothetical protein
MQDPTPKRDPEAMSPLPGQRMKLVTHNGSKGYLIGQYFFKSKKDLLISVRTILHAYTLFSSVSEAHHDFLFNLIACHPEAELKIGAGIKFFEIRPIPRYKHKRGFWIIREDGSEVDWSYTKIIYPLNQFALFRRVCRVAIADQLLEYKLKWFREYAKQGSFVCQITGETCSVECAHVDHEAPLTLDALVKAFVAEYQVDVDNVTFQEVVSEGVGYIFDDMALKAQWQAFHQLHAKLRVVSDTANLKLAKKHCV